MNNILFGGVDSRSESSRAFVHYETIAGGAGGGPDGPGAHGIQTHMTNTLNTPIEALEHNFPVIIERYALGEAPDAHAGDTPGGAGVVRRYRFLATAEVNLITERRRLAPYGLNEAASGRRGSNTLIRSDLSPQALPGKVTLEVKPGEAIEVCTPSGGSWRPPMPE
jgi:N-methylhydantoinase B